MTSALIAICIFLFFVLAITFALIKGLEQDMEGY